MVVILRGILLISFVALGLAQNATNETTIVPIVNNTIPLVPLNSTFQNATNETTIVPIVNNTISLVPLNSTFQNATQGNVTNNNFTLKGYYEVTTSTLNAVPLNLTDLSIVPINNDTKLVMIVPCRDHFNIPPYKKLINAYKSTGKHTIINFDWKNIANYSDSEDEQHEIAGDQLAMFIVALQNKGMKESNIHIIAQGNGVKVASHAAKLIPVNNSGRISRLTALNPPRRNFWSSVRSLFKDDEDSQLKPTDAIQVDTLHTMGGHTPSGGVDFYANKGKKQPGCYEDDACYYERSLELMAESVQSKDFVAQKCTYRFFSGWRCSDEHSIVFGEHMPTEIFEGSYVFYTKSVSPYARGY